MHAPQTRVVLHPTTTLARRAQTKAAAATTTKVSTHSNPIAIAHVDGSPPDPAVKTLANNLVAFLDAVRGVLPADPVFVDGTLSKLVATILLDFVRKLPRIDSSGSGPGFALTPLPDAWPTACCACT